MFWRHLTAFWNKSRWMEKLAERCQTRYPPWIGRTIKSKSSTESPTRLKQLGKNPCRSQVSQRAKTSPLRICWKPSLKIPKPSWDNWRVDLSRLFNILLGCRGWCEIDYSYYTLKSPLPLYLRKIVLFQLIGFIRVHLLLLRVLHPHALSFHHQPCLRILFNGPVQASFFLGTV